MGVTAADDGTAIKTVKIRKINSEMLLQKEHRQFLRRMRKVLLPKADMNDFAAERIQRKLQKYKRLFVTGCFDSDDDVAMDDAVVDPTEDYGFKEKIDSPRSRALLE